MSKHTKVRSYTTVELIKQAKLTRGFRHIPEEKWLLFVRSNEDTPNVFDDKCYEMFGESCVGVHSCTTNPGVPSLLGGFRKYKKSGAAVVGSDQWMYNKFAYGLHNGRMPALRLVRPIYVYRDGNLDKKIDESPEGLEHGNFNTNIHANNYDMKSKVIRWVIGGWSAGCLVFNNIPKYKRLVDYFKKLKASGEQSTVTALIISEF